MTPEKALSLFKRIRSNYINERCCCDDVDEDVTAIDYAISLIEKEAGRLDIERQANWFDNHLITGIERSKRLKQESVE